MPGTELSHLPRMGEKSKHLTELELWVVGLHHGNVSNMYTRTEVFH